MAELFETYYQNAFGSSLKTQPQVHRVIPVNQTVKNDMEVHPYESALGIIEDNNSWAVFDCICRKQKALIGDPCEHPIESCMTFNKRENAYDGSDFYRALTKEEAIEVLMGAAEAGLVHSVSNSKDGTSYICNCCTCSCGILRGMKELGIANVIAKSAFVNTVDPELCIACGDCLFHCQFDALDLQEVMEVDETKCVGCGVCVPFCDEKAMILVRRPEEEIEYVPSTEEEWGDLRMGAR
jgi:ferredoxin